MAIERHFIQEGVIRSEVESFLRNELNRAGYSGINIQKTPLSTKVTLYVEKPPIVIGKKGKRINSLTKILSERFKIENPSIDVQKIERPTLDANIIARRIAVALERGMNRRRVAYKAVRAVIGSGARGVEIILSGKIVGKGGRSRAEKYREGYMKNAGDSSKLVQIGSTQAYLKAGVIGVTVKIVPPNTKFPDQVEVLKREDVKLDEPLTEDKKTQKKAKKKTTTKKKSKKEKQDKAKKEEKPQDSVSEVAQTQKDTSGEKSKEPQEDDLKKEAEA
jgi:small subunit ribosomal protein S3